MTHEQRKEKILAQIGYGIANLVSVLVDSTDRMSANSRVFYKGEMNKIVDNLNAILVDLKKEEEK